MDSFGSYTVTLALLFGLLHDGGAVQDEREVQIATDEIAIH